MASAMDATTLLTSDHEQVRTMFREFDSGAAQTEQLFHRIRDALQLHMTIEE